MLGAAVGACEGRFPVCRTNEDCAGKGGDDGQVCFNLRCVQCRYDVDCPGGKACSASNECVALSTGSPELEDAGAVPWDPGSFQGCAADCKDEACLEACGKRFEK